jgi:hypothetical protein
MDTRRFFLEFEFGEQRLGPQWDLDSSMLTHEELEVAFGKREQNGWNAKPNELITCTNYVGFQKLCELVYGHVPTNDDYLTIFCVVGWNNVRTMK